MFISLLMTIWMGSHAFEYRIVSKTPMNELNGAEVLLANETDWSTESFGVVENGIVDIKGESVRTYPAHLIVTNQMQNPSRENLMHYTVSLIVEPDTIVVDVKERLPLSGGKFNQGYLDIHKLLQETGFNTDSSKKVYKECFYKNIGNGLGERALMNYGLICSPDEWMEMTGHLDDETRGLAAIENMTERKERLRSSWEGMPFVEIEGVTLEGDSIRLSDYVGKGQYVVADMWASWCKPCILEAKENLKPLYEKYKDNPHVLILGLAMDDVSGTVAKHGIEWPQIQNCDKQFMAKYGVYVIPEIVIFGPDGTILRRFLRGNDVKVVLEELLGEGLISKDCIGGQRLE